MKMSSNTPDPYWSSSNVLGIVYHWCYKMVSHKQFLKFLKIFILNMVSPFWYPGCCETHFFYIIFHIFICFFIAKLSFIEYMFLSYYVHIFEWIYTLWVQIPWQGLTLSSIYLWILERVNWASSSEVVASWDCAKTLFLDIL